MFRYTRGELAKKSNAELSAIFHLATERVSAMARQEPETVEAEALLVLLRKELRRRFEPDARL